MRGTNHQSPRGNASSWPTSHGRQVTGWSMHKSPEPQLAVWRCCLKPWLMAGGLIQPANRGMQKPSSRTGDRCTFPIFPRKWGLCRLQFIIFRYCSQLEPHKAVAEILKIGNLWERLAIVMHGWQSKSTDGSKCGWSVGLAICLSICLSNELINWLTN